jgi:hypothetical protein
MTIREIILMLNIIDTKLRLYYTILQMKMKKTH